MGTFRFSGRGVDTARLTLDRLTELPLVTSTATKLQLGTAQSDAVLTATGTGFAYTRTNGLITDVTAGTISSLTALSRGVAGDTTLTGTNLNLSMATLADHAFAGDWFAFRTVLFSRADTFFGTAGDDTLAGFAGRDSIYGGRGEDMLVGGDGNDRLFAGDDNDTLRGGEGNDSLSGGQAIDYLYGSTGTDTLEGGLGNDILHGGGGRDELYGGSGQDAFVFNTAVGFENVDFVLNFSVADDVFWLDRSVFRGFSQTGTIGQGQFHVGLTAHDSNDRILFDAVEGVVSYDRDGSGAARADVIAVIDLGIALTFRDFFII